MLPIQTLELFPVLDCLLDEVLRQLTPSQWQAPTLAGRWRVYDVALHLLDGNLRNLSMLRDGHFAPSPTADLSEYDQLVTFINTQNHDWVRVGQRLSPRLVTDLLRWSGEAFYQAISQLDPNAPAIFPVAWAGEAVSPNWFHIAREYTERWHHQAQIRLAVMQEAPLLKPHLYLPFLETSLRGLPHQLRTVLGTAGDRLLIEVGDLGQWAVVYATGGWMLAPAPSAEPHRATVYVPTPLAWQLFTKGLRPAEVAGAIKITGDSQLAWQALGLVAVMA